MPALVQISDLHRSQDEPIDNDTLLASLIGDIERFSLTHERPSALVVSGDLVQGVRLGASNYEADMREQYESAFDLIGRLADEIANGDRSQVCIVPGNHDVCWNTSQSTVELVSTNDYPNDIPQALKEHGSLYRWSWKDLALYKIQDPSKHTTRLNNYWSGLEAFYDGIQLPLPVDKHRGFHFFKLFESRALLVGFESTHGNDHLCFEGDFETGVIGRCAMELRKQEHTPQLLGAVWHHSISGSPNQNDYLNINAVRELAGQGFQIGLHGHQHIAESTDLSVSIGEGYTMSVVSAGSLCAGQRELPRGTDRQYNIVVLDEDLASGQLHVREMVEGNQFSDRRNGRFLGGNVNLCWSPRTDAGGRPISSSETEIVNLTIKIDDAMQKGVISDNVIDLLRLKDSLKGYPRAVLVRALQMKEDWANLVQVIGLPQSSVEALALAEAAVGLSDIDLLKKILESPELPAINRAHYVVRLKLMSLGE